VIWHIEIVTLASAGVPKYAQAFGDRVTYGKYAGQKLVVKGVKFLLLNDDEITSILPDGVEVAAYLG
jgi:co-chaperonin GroES (HSP10)